MDNLNTISYASLMTRMYQHGMGLLESLLAVGVVGGLALVINQLSRNAGKVVTNLEMNDDIKVTLQQIQATLSDSENCTTTFNGKRANSASNVVQLLKKKNATGYADAFKTITASPTVSYGQKTLKINSYSLSDASPEVDVATLGTTQLLIDFNRGSRGIQTNSIIKKINLRVVVDGAGNITSCVAFDTVTNDIWKIATNNTDIYFNTGNVAVGVTAPSANLTVKATTFPLQTGMMISGNESTIAGWNRAAATYNDSTSAQTWKVAAFGTSSVEGEGKFGINQNGVSRLILTKNGNMGIGTSKPNCEVTSCENLDNGKYLQIHSSGTGVVDGATILLSSNSLTNNSIVGSLAFGTMARSGPDKRVAGITGHTISTPGLPLEGRMLFWSSPNGTLAWNMVLTELGDLWIRGNFTTASVHESSDRRLKKDITPIHHSLKKINTLQGVSFDWKDTRLPGKQLGLIAQKVEKVFPEIVKRNEEGFKIISYTALMAPIIDSFKDLKSIWNKSENRLKNLKHENEKLKKYLCNKDATAPFCNRVAP